VLGHFGTEDEFIGPEQAKELEAEMQAAGIETAFEFYEGAGHAFANDHDRLGTYDEGHAKKAWDRTVSFLKEKLGGG
jgi:carboxymethylenebutenolidase